LNLVRRFEPCSPPWQDAAFFFWSLAVERAKLLGPGASEAALEDCHELSERAEV